MSMFSISSLADAKLDGDINRRSQLAAILDRDVRGGVQELAFQFLVDAFVVVQVDVRALVQVVIKSRRPFSAP